MFAREGIREGMIVYSSDGQKLGKVFAMGEDQFQIEKGLFFPKEYLCRYSDIADIRGDEIILRFGKDSLLPAGEKAGRGEEIPLSATSDERAWREDERLGRTRMEGSEDVRIPLAQEELDVVKRERSAGEVQVRKHVETEVKTVDVPIRKETVEVERVPASGSTAEVSAGAFKDETVSVPLTEEEVEIRKRPVVREEVRVRKHRREEEQRVAETVRREEADIEGDEVSRSIGSPDIDPLTRK